MYYDLLSKIKNASMAKKDNITVPYSKMDEAVLNVLSENGYIKGIAVDVSDKKKNIIVRCAYKGKKSAVNDFKIVSKPSRKSYIDYRSLRPIRQGYGISVLSTPNGIMSGKDARKNKIGGEYLFEIW
jgi:small subunit ribosomal protein S8